MNMHFSNQYQYLTPLLVLVFPKLLILIFIWDANRLTDGLVKILKFNKGARAEAGGCRMSVTDTVTKRQTIYYWKWRKHKTTTKYVSLKHNNT